MVELALGGFFQDFNVKKLTSFTCFLYAASGGREGKKERKNFGLVFKYHETCRAENVFLFKYSIPTLLAFILVLREMGQGQKSFIFFISRPVHIKVLFNSAMFLIHFLVQL